LTTDPVKDKTAQHRSQSPDSSLIIISIATLVKPVPIALQILRPLARPGWWRYKQE
jgi:hypothetical protein